MLRRRSRRAYRLVRAPFPFTYLTVLNGKAGRDGIARARARTHARMRMGAGVCGGVPVETLRRRGFWLVGRLVGGLTGLVLGRWWR